jgi:hypothetical protein
MWRTAMAAWVWTTITVLTILASGCHMTDSSGDDLGDYGHGTAAELGELLKRPDAEEVLARRDAMAVAIGAALSATVPGSQWIPNGRGDQVSCGNFGSTRGRKYTSPAYQSPVPIAPDRWAAATAAVIEAAAPFDYTDVRMRTERPTIGAPSTLEILSNDGTDGRFWLGSDRYANFYIRTGCFLTAKAKQAARDAAPPTSQPK